MTHLTNYLVVYLINYGTFSPPYISAISGHIDKTSFCTICCFHYLLSLTLLAVSSCAALLIYMSVNYYRVVLYRLFGTTGTQKWEFPPPWNSEQSCSTRRYWSDATLCTRESRGRMSASWAPCTQLWASLMGWRQNQSLWFTQGSQVLNADQSDICPPNFVTPQGVGWIIGMGVFHIIHIIIRVAAAWAITAYRSMTLGTDN